jgi:hypothetical protein
MPRFALWKPSGGAFGCGLRFLVLFLPIESHSIVLARLRAAPVVWQRSNGGRLAFVGPRVLAQFRESVSIPRPHHVDQTDFSASCHYVCLCVEILATAVSCAMVQENAS